MWNVSSVKKTSEETTHLLYLWIKEHQVCSQSLKITKLLPLTLLFENRKLTVYFLEQIHNLGLGRVRGRYIVQVLCILTSERVLRVRSL